MARRHRCDSAPIGLGHFPVGSNRSGLMVLGARRCRGLHHEGLEAYRLCENSDVELARRKFVSITLNKKRTALAVTVERKKERKQ